MTYAHFSYWWLGVYRQPACLKLLYAGYGVAVVDTLANSKAEAVWRVQEFAGNPLAFHRVDLRDHEALDAVFRRHPIDTVIHFLRRCVQGESRIALDGDAWTGDHVRGCVALASAESAGV